MRPGPQAELLPLLRLAEAARDVLPDGGPDLVEAVQQYPERCLLSRWQPGWARGGEVPPILGAVLLTAGVRITGPELAEAVQAAATAFAADGSFLLLATTLAQRDDAKRRIQAALRAMAGPTQPGRPA